MLLSAVPILFSSWSYFVIVINRNLYLFIIMIFLSLYAISNNIGLGPVNFVYYYLPGFILELVSTFRASGRMFWPVFYVIIFTTIFLMIKNYKENAKIFLVLALIIQVVDTSAGWRSVRKKNMIDPIAEWNTPLVSQFWEEAAAKYEKVRYVPNANQPPDYSYLASYAGLNGLSTDAVYLARIALDGARQKTEEVLQSGKFEHDSLYVMADSEFRQAAINLNEESSLLAKIDGFNVVAPGWKSCSDCSYIEDEITLSDLMPPIKPGEKILFDRLNTGSSYLVYGWSSPEDWGIWSGGLSAGIVLPIPPEQADSILIEANVFVNASYDAIANQRLTVSVNAVPVTELVLTEPAVTFEIKIPESVKEELKGGNIELSFSFPDAISPKDVGLSVDTRKLALGLVALTVR